MQPERERQAKNRDESSRHRSLSLSRHHWVGLGVLWELVRRWTFVFDSHKAVSPPQQPVNILYGFTVKEKVASALAPLQHTQYTSRGASVCGGLGAGAGG
eukprot:scaffold66834_cov54-Phaeocystis_antarctica.AAC.3